MKKFDIFDTAFDVEELWRYSKSMEKLKEYKDLINDEVNKACNEGRWYVNIDLPIKEKSEISRILVKHLYDKDFDVMMSFIDNDHTRFTINWDLDGNVRICKCDPIEQENIKSRFPFKF